MKTAEIIDGTKQLIKEAEGLLKSFADSSPGERVHERATEVARNRSVSYAEAVALVVAEDRELARSYAEETFESARGNFTVRRD